MRKRKTQDEGTSTLQSCPPLLTIEQVARILCIGRSSVYELINKDGLPYVSMQRGKRFRPDSLTWWIAQHEHSTLEHVSTYLSSQSTLEISEPKDAKTSARGVTPVRKRA